MPAVRPPGSNRIFLWQELLIEIIPPKQISTKEKRLSKQTSFCNRYPKCIFLFKRSSPYEDTVWLEIKITQNIDSFLDLMIPYMFPLPVIKLVMLAALMSLFDSTAILQVD